MYAIVCSHSTSELWTGAIATLKDKYERRWPGEVYTILYDSKAADVSTCLSKLREVRPSYCCFVARHSECSRPYVHQIHELTSQIDPSNPYTDTLLWYNSVRRDCMLAKKASAKEYTPGRLTKYLFTPQPP